MLSPHLPHFEVASLSSGSPPLPHTEERVCVCAVHPCSHQIGCVGGRETPCANLHPLWRIQGHAFMFRQPLVNQFPIKVVLDSAATPVPAPCFSPRCFRDVKAFFPLICCDVSDVSCLAQPWPVRLSDDAGCAGHVRPHASISLTLLPRSVHKSFIHPGPPECLHSLWYSLDST